MRQINISTKNIFLTLCGFELTWFTCVIGEYKDLSNIGIIVGLIYLAVFFYFVADRSESLKICAKFSFIGIFFDSFLSYSELLVINSNYKIGFIPLWLVILWLSFSTLFIEILSFLSQKPIIAFLGGFALVPPTYYLGIVLNIATSSNIFLAMTIMAIFWGSLLCYYSLSKRK
jgi:hypothetical protein